jgi:hypothetical protein
MQSYAISGEFTVFSKLKAALKENLIFYGISLALCAIIIIILFAIKKLESGLSVIITAGNLWGIFFLIALLGYGLVDLPRNLWRRANRTVLLKYCKFKIVDYANEIEDCRADLEDKLKLFKKFCTEIPKDSENRSYLEEIAQYVKKEIAMDTLDLIPDTAELVVDKYDNFVDLNVKLRSSFYHYTTAKCLFEETMKQAIYLDDVLSARNKGWRQPIVYSMTKKQVCPKCCEPVTASLDWFWSIVSPVVWRILSVLCIFLSITLVWSEAIFPFFSTIFSLCSSDCSCRKS